jgi:hypothetical protein
VRLEAAEELLEKAIFVGFGDRSVWLFPVWARLLRRRQRGARQWHCCGLGEWRETAVSSILLVYVELMISVDVVDNGVLHKE